MVDPSVYLNSSEKRAEVETFKRRMVITTIIVLMLIAGTTTLWYFLGYDWTGKIWIAASTCYQTLLWSMLLTWAWSLYSLYRDVKHSKKLLPEKKLFILHGSLLASFLVCFLLSTTLWQVANRDNASP